jgi:hypothetical protein
VQRAVRAFFDANEAWLEDVFARGRAQGSLAFAGAPLDAARQWTSTLEGAMLLARPYREPARLTSVSRRLIDALRSPREARVPAAPRRARRAERATRRPRR